MTLAPSTKHWISRGVKIQERNVRFATMWVRKHYLALRADRTYEIPAWEGAKRIRVVIDEEGTRWTRAWM